MGTPVTIVQIAKESGVSIATVSRVINGTAPVAPATRERVNAVIKKYHYTPNALARGLINRQTMTIGIIIPDISNPYFSAMFQEFESAAREAGYSVFLCNTSFFSAAGNVKTTPLEVEYFQMMQDKRVDGVLVVGGQADLTAVNEEYKAALQHLTAHVPVVVLGSKIEGVDCPFIQRESGYGVSFAIEYLAMLGHRRIAFIGGEDGVGITEARLRSYQSALRSLGLPQEPELIVTSDYYVPDGYTAMQSLLKRNTPFTAFLAVNDNVAFGAYRAIADAGLRIPQDISAVSCDQFFSAEYFVPRLTSIDQHNEQFGRIVINVLLNVIRGTQENVHLTTLPELIIRESCIAVPASC